MAYLRRSGCRYPAAACMACLPPLDLICRSSFHNEDKAEKTFRQSKIIGRVHLRKMGSQRRARSDAGRRWSGAGGSMDRFAGIRAFVRVAERGGFTAAARHLNLSIATVSAQVQALEESLGARLLNRTTRRVSLT